MNEAKRLRYQQPRFMAVEQENKGREHTQWGDKKLRVDATVLLTWGAVIVLTIIFWFLVVKLL